MTTPSVYSIAVINYLNMITRGKTPRSVLLAVCFRDASRQGVRYYLSGAAEERRLNWARDIKRNPSLLGRIIPILAQTSHP